MSYSIDQAKKLKELAFANGFDMLDLQAASMVVVGNFCLTAADTLKSDPLKRSEMVEYVALAKGIDTICQGIESFKASREANHE